MTRGKRIMFLIFSVILLIGISIAGYFVYRELKQPVHKAIDAIPVDADIVIKVKSPLSVWNEELVHTDIWKGISGFEDFVKFENSVHWLDSLIHTDALALKIVNERPLYISAHPITNNSYSALFLYEIPQEFTHGINEFFSRIASPDKFNISKSHNVLMYTNKLQSGISFYIVDGLFVSSFNNNLLLKSVDQLKSKINLTHDLQYKQAAFAEGEKTEISVYINHSSLYRRLSAYVNKSLNPWILTANDIHGWSNTDVLLRKDLLLMSGFITTSDLSYLQCFREAPVEDAKFAEELDEQTFYLYSMSVRSFDNYQEKYHIFQQKNHCVPNSSAYVEDSIYSLSAVTALWKKIDPVQLILSASTYSDSIGWMITVKPRDIIIAEQSILGEMTNMKIDTTTYKGYKIGKLLLGRSARIFGDNTFSPLDIQYFAVSNEYIQFSSSKNIITRSIDRKVGGNSLSKSYIFKSFCNDINPQAALLVYFSPFEGDRVIKDSFDTSCVMGKLLKVLAGKTPYLGIQIGAYQQPYYSCSLCWKYLVNSAPAIKEEKSEGVEPVQKKPAHKKKLSKSVRKVNKTASKKEKASAKKSKK